MLEAGVGVHLPNLKAGENITMVMVTHVNCNIKIAILFLEMLYLRFCPPGDGGGGGSTTSKIELS